MSLISSIASRNTCQSSRAQLRRSTLLCRYRNNPAFALSPVGVDLERGFGTFEDWLLGLMWADSITTIDAANQYLQSYYLPKHNGGVQHSSHLLNICSPGSKRFRHGCHPVRPRGPHRRKRLQDQL
ncbi:MAG: hypothetical protein LBE38_06445 [Deltaproteobacteria bacterium]|nr:hypothetical protein [Deltaproteobacteria bacterium]